MIAKFHFVDLAGSERIKKTGAIGVVLKEGTISKGSPTNALSVYPNIP